MEKDSGRLIKVNFKKDYDDKKSSNTPRKCDVVDIRKNQMSKMVDDLVSIIKKNEDFLEG